MSSMQVLLIEDDPGHADLIRMHISRKHGGEVEIQWVDRLAKGIERLANSSIDIILLDLGLPDSSVDKTLGVILSKAQGTPVVVLSSLEDEDFGIKAVHEGAQDYISKSWMDGELLFRALRYAIERKAIEEKLRNANRMKDEFLATLSHELRTPISVIKGFAEILSQGNLADADECAAMSAILRNAQLQVHLIDDILDMSRIITGKLVLQTSPTNLQPIIEDAIGAVKFAAQSKLLTIKTFFDPAVGMILGDHLRLHQILWNLLSNSIKFTPSKGCIEVRLKEGLDSQVEIEISDTGEGIDPAFLPYAFDRFSQQDSSIRRHHGGLGLGLAIVRYLVELHGGTVSIRSDGVGMGTVFTISLPCQQLQNEKSKTLSDETVGENKSENAIRRLSSQERFAHLSGIRVLAIDDSPDSLFLVATFLKRYGAEVTTADSAAQAWSVLDHLNPDMIVCDIGMPNEDGYTFLRKLRTREKERGSKNLIPAAALTAFVREEDRKEALDAGFNVHLSKPVEEQALVRVVRGLITPGTGTHTALF